MTVNEQHRYFLERLQTIYEEREATNIADWVFESVAGIKRLNRITDTQKKIDPLAVKQLNTVLEQLLQHKPVQYVLGEVWFYKMKLFVNDAVLIPRPETEELVEWVAKEFKDHKIEATILDIGTGSGCIAIAIKKEVKQAAVFAVDISEDALQVARQNAMSQNTKINFSQVDFLKEAQWKSLSSFDVIVSNPPYIPHKEKSILAKNVVEYEPHVALFVADDDAFVFYRKIAAFAVDHLKKDGKIFVEVHEKFFKPVQQIFADKNFLTEVRKDIYGRERMIKAYQ